MKKKIYFVVPAALVLLGGLYIVSKQSDGLLTSERIEIAMRSKNFVHNLNRGDFDACYNSLSPDMQDKTGIERLHALLDPILGFLGKFEEFRGGNISRERHKDTSTYVCNLKCDYENGRAIFTIILDEKMNIVNLYIK